MSEEQVQEIVAEEAQEVTPEVQEQEAPEPVREWSDEDAEEAKAFGWKSPDEWAGEIPSGYIDDPRRYMERAQNFRPFKALKEQLDTATRDSAERLRKLEAVSQKAIADQRAAHERELESITRRQREAVDNADGETWEQLEKEKASLQSPAPVEDRPQVDPYVAEYKATEAGKWLNNPILAEAGARAINAGGMNGAPVSEQVKYAEKHVREAYPHSFEQPKPAPAPKPQTPRVDGGGLAQGGGKSSGFSKLPTEAKSAFKMMAGQGIYQDTDADRKRYADDYNAA